METKPIIYPYGIIGNTIVVVDVYGNADPVLYPTHEPWTVTPAHAEKDWDANDSGLNTCSQMFMVAKADAKGKGGSATSITWYEASGTTHATYNPNGYSACAQYSEASDQSDKGTWRLPTVRELRLIYDMKAELAVVIPNLNYLSVTEYDDQDRVLRVLHQRLLRRHRHEHENLPCALRQGSLKALRVALTLRSFNPLAAAIRRGPDSETNIWNG